MEEESILEIGSGEEALRQLKERQSLFFKNVRLLKSYGKHLSQEDEASDILMHHHKSSNIQDNILHSFELPHEHQTHSKDIMNTSGCYPIYQQHQYQRRRMPLISDHPQNLDTFDDIHIFNIKIGLIKNLIIFKLI